MSKNPVRLRESMDPAKAAAREAERQRVDAVMEARREHEAMKAALKLGRHELQRQADFKARHARTLGLSPDNLLPVAPASDATASSTREGPIPAICDGCGRPGPVCLDGWLTGHPCPSSLNDLNPAI